MSPAGDARRRRRRKIIGALSAVVMAATVVTGAVINYWPGGSTLTGGGTAGGLRLDLLASRDLGALPQSSSWCSGSDHCWPLQHTSGDATDYGGVGGWTMSVQGTPRAGLPTGLPALDATGWVDTSTELASWFDSAGNYYKKTSVTALTEPVTITAIFKSPRVGLGSANIIADLGYQSGQGYWLYTTSAPALRVAARGGGEAGMGINVDAVTTDDAWHCVTVTMDATNSRVWVDGAESAWSSAWSYYGVPTGSINVGIGERSTGLFNFGGGIARLKVSGSTAGSLAKHRADCGTWATAPAGGAADNQPLEADDTWTQTGGAVCYPTGDSSAVCQPGGVPHYTVDSTGLGFVVEGGATNRILFNTAIDCVNWTCATATTNATVAPDGSLTAAAITMGGGTIDATATGYSASAALTARLWARCSSGTLDASNIGGAGHWTVDCSTVGGSWALLTSSHAAVTEVQSWQSTGAGAVVLRLSGADASVWAPTVTEEPGTGYAVIPTAASAVSTGDAAWTIDNTSGGYYQAGDTVTQMLSQITGTCWVVSGTDLLLTGAAGSECSGVWYGLQVQ